MTPLTFAARRRFLAHSGLAITGLCAASLSAGEPPAKSPRPALLDTHTHFYDPTRPQGVPWPGKEDKLLYRRVLPADYRRVGDPLGVTGTVVVEASPWPDDNLWLLRLAAEDPFLVAVVGNLRPGSDDFAREWPKLIEQPKFRGLRVSGRDLAEHLADAAWRRDLARMAEAGRTLDVNGGPDHLPAVVEAAKALPSLKIVINHIGGVAVDGREPPADWVRGVRAAAKPERVYCKVSALVEYAAPRGRPLPADWQAPRDAAFYRPVLDVLWESFGEERLVYGSNWPVSERFAPLAVVQQIATNWITAKGRPAAERFFAGNARKAYG